MRRTMPVTLEDGEVFQQRNYADDDDDGAHNLLGATVDRQQIHEIKHENDDDECCENADEDRHEIPRDERIPPRTLREITRFRPVGSAATKLCCMCECL